MQGRRLKYSQQPRRFELKVYLKEGRNPGTVISDSNVPLELHIDLDDEETANRLEGMTG